MTAKDDACGSIVTIGTRVFFVPCNSQLPHLKWDAGQQRFIDLQCDEHDVSLFLSLRQTISADTQEDDGDVDHVTKTIPCCALFGVLPIGTISILLYVTQRERIATLPLASSHDVFAVRQLGWMRLPSQSVASSASVGVGNEEKAVDSDEDETLRLTLQHQLPETTILEYCSVLDQFCTHPQQHSGCSYFFYSPTLNLALDASEMDWGSLASCRTPAFQGEYSRNGVEFGSAHEAPGELRSQMVFQWNTPLLEAFKLSRAAETQGISFCLPAFIRGVVALSPVAADGVRLLLISRLSYRWSGTRYNRRGLDPAGTGIPANFSVSTLWVLPEEENCSSRGTPRQKRIASFVLVRGSIPRRWNQPAKLTFKPDITISPSTVAAEELTSHINALQVLLYDMSTLHCLDTTSSSKLEFPLSKAFETAVGKRRDGDVKPKNSPEVYYTKYNVKERKKKLLSYDQMQEEVNALVSVECEDSKSYVDFSHWCTDNAVAGDEKSSCEGENSCGSFVPRPFVWKQLHQQQHYIRVNCLDCLDRTNLVQSMIALGVLPRMIRYVRGEEDDVVGKPDAKGDFTTDDSKLTFSASKRLCRQLWAQQGIALSQLYAGSDPHFLELLLNGKSGLYDTCREGKLALQRWWQQNFYDGDKQDAVSLLTRQHNPSLFHSKFESPFSRRLSALNKMVVLGVLVAIGAAGLNFIMMFVFNYRMRQEFLAFEFFWLAYIGVLISQIMKDGVSYTNYPLLK